MDGFGRAENRSRRKLGEESPNTIRARCRVTSVLTGDTRGRQAGMFADGKCHRKLDRQYFARNVGKGEKVR